MKSIFGLSKVEIGGRTLYVSPKPYPVPCPAYDYGSNVMRMDGCFLDWGKSAGAVFPWQMLIGMPLGILVIFVLMFPLVTIGFGFLSGDISSAIRDAPGHLVFSFSIGGPGALLVLFLIANATYNSIKNHAIYMPVRFNRQRREVCFIPEGKSDPIFIDCEDVKIWVGDYASASQYGVVKHYSLGFSFKDKRSGEEFDMEFSAMGLPMALGSWELIRSFMDYEIDSLREVDNRPGVNVSVEGGPEGVAFFKAKRRQLHGRFRNREVGLFYFIGWYLYHISTFWTVPNRLAEWEVKEVERLKQDNAPEEMKQWSMSLPEASWRLPSKEFVEESNRVRSIFSNNPGLSMYEAFDAVHQQMSRELQHEPTVKANSG